MITYTNIQRHDNIPFEDYLKLEGFSHSFLKRERDGIVEPLTITENIRIGKLVDAILTDPAAADMFDSLYPLAKSIAFEIRKTFGTLIEAFQKQISYTAQVSYGDFTMQTTGRLDFLLPKHAVLDLKVTKSKIAQIPALIEFMGYENQVWHYCKMAGVNSAYLLFYSIPEKKTVVRFIDCSSDTNEFWANKTMMHGKVAA